MIDDMCNRLFAFDVCAISDAVTNVCVMPRLSRSPSTLSTISTRSRSPSRGRSRRRRRSEVDSRKRRRHGKDKRRGSNSRRRERRRSRRARLESSRELQRWESATGAEDRPSELTDSVSQLGEAICQGIGRLAESVGVRQAEHQVVSKSSTKIIKEFNPISKDVTEWLEAVDEFAYIYGWNDRTTCHLALSKLKGPAEVWYRALPTRIFTWSEWKEMLNQQFRPKRNLYAELREMMDCVARNDQSLYAFDKIALIQKLKLQISGIDQVNLILGGISDDLVKFSVETAGIAEPSDLARHFKMLDERKDRSIRR